MLTMTRAVRIEWGDCDPAGIRALSLPADFFERFRRA